MRFSLFKTVIFSFLLLLPIVLLAQKQPEKKLGWTLSAQTYTFNRFTFAEALEKTKAAGLKSIEAYNGQPIGGGINGNFSFDMDEATRKAVVKLLKKNKIKLTAFGVVNGNSDEEWRQLFEFSKLMKIKYINTEPDEKFLPLIGKLASEYKIHVGIHNHPKASKYWDPQVVLDAIAKANSPYVGACADIGHWVRSGLDPVASLKRYEGHLKSMHFKDLKAKDRNTHDVHWGTGVGDIPAVIAELKRQRFKGNISAEYEHNWDDNVGDVTQSVKNFRAILTGK